MVSKVAWYLESHSNISEVAKAVALPKGSKARKKELERIRLQGKYYHNIRVLETGSGEIIPYRRSQEQLKPSDFLSCPSCLGFFKKDELWKHNKACLFKVDNQEKNENSISYKKRAKSY